MRDHASRRPTRQLPRAAEGTLSSPRDGPTPRAHAATPPQTGQTQRPSPPLRAESPGYHPEGAQSHTGHALSAAEQDARKRTAPRTGVPIGTWTDRQPPKRAAPCSRDTPRTRRQVRRHEDATGFVTLLRLRVQLKGRSLVRRQPAQLYNPLRSSQVHEHLLGVCPHG